MDTDCHGERESGLGVCERGHEGGETLGEVVDELLDPRHALHD